MGIWKKIGAFIDAMSENDAQKPQEESPEEKQKRLEREKTREKYTHEYMLRKDLEKLEDQIEELQEKASAKFEKAKEFLKRGDRRNANLQAQACDQLNAMIGVMQRRAAAFEIKISFTQIGGVSFDIMQHLSAYSQLMGNGMDIGELNSAFADIDMNSATIEELDNMLKKSWENDAKKNQKKNADADVESDTLKLVESEVLGEMTTEGDSAIATDPNAAENSTSAQADKGLKELEDLINGKK